MGDDPDGAFPRAGAASSGAVGLGLAGGGSPRVEECTSPAYARRVMSEKRDDAAPVDSAVRDRLRRFFRPVPDQGEPVHPGLLAQERRRAQARQNRIADAITSFSGSMLFVYVHILWFACWIGFGVEKYPYGLLTMIVSLEAIFLSTFVLISQNRADSRRQVIADQQWKMVQDEDAQNVELLDLSQQILALTKEVHQLARTMANRPER